MSLRMEERPIEALAISGEISGEAIVALVFGLMALVVPFVPALLALVFATMARGQVGARGAGGIGMARAAELLAKIGLIMNLIVVVVMTLAFVLVIRGL
jgi:hypothetical protein